ncbi:hypothetical protein MIMGU_mgv1a026610mg [Erythranthe guttata]|uniref:RING-type E3 ubiquitin transferase n=1 Tax=Erythranthe guttata TaxID=4155 RepID=A0A022RQ58_ERYGU|nr:hypothetical protein MIMGU_mgv1a026610mg [Erythranthe guttata]
MAHLRRFNFSAEFQRAAAFHHPPPPPPPLLPWAIPGRIFPTAHRPRLCSDSVFAVHPSAALLLVEQQLLRDEEQQEHADRTAAGLSEDQITKCLKIKININSCRDIEESEVCVICFDDLCQENNKNNIGALECGHEYHSDCIRHWLRMKNFCPLCKALAFKCCPVRSSC